MRFFLVSILAIAVAACSGPSSRKAPRRPNIVVIYADDHAERAIGACGSPFAHTPNIDRLAAGGMRFTQSFVANSICGPARATFLTGLHSHANGMTSNRSRLRRDVPNIAQRLQAAGYRTGVIGKWHLDSDPEGFDDWALLRGGYYNPDLVTAAGRSPTTGYTTEIVTENALRWLEARRGKDEPFFTWISHTASHRTWRPGPQYLKRYDGTRIEEPGTLFDDYAGRSRAAAEAQMRISRDLFPAYDLKLPVTGEGILDTNAENMLAGMTEGQRAAWRAAYDDKNRAFAEAELGGKELVRWKYQRYMRDYLRCVDALDDSVGAILDYLEESGLSENTIVIYTSDQGFFLGEHGWYDKRWMYEPSLRTPLIVRWPGVTQGGSTNDRLVQNIDLAPTLAAMADLRDEPEMHGASLVPLLRGQTPPWRDAIYYHYQQLDSGRTSHTVARHCGVRGERFKLMHLYDYDDWELYDLESDPDEVRNLYGNPEYAETAAALRETLADLQHRFGDRLQKR
ncbi:MAG: sulfatase [Planctomycetes bacterium]|jgi:arylsulfatase A-like enzyme|nr:sulfatase [Planctomycetota bacterium]